MARGKLKTTSKDQLSFLHRLIGVDLGKVIKECHNGSGSSYTRVAYCTDFIGDSIDAVLNTAVVGTTPTAALVSGEHKVALTLDSTDEAESARLDMGDQLNFGSTLNPYFEALCEFTRNGAAASYAIIGLASAYNSNPDSVANNIWFKIIDSGTAISLVVEGDDGTTDTDDVATGYTIASGTQYRFSIDMSDLSNIVFKVNDTIVAKKKIAVSALTGNLQPYFIVAKASGASQAKLESDFFRVETDRT